MKDGLVFWFTGLSGSGKTTIAEAVRDRLQDQYKVVILDGDVVRERFHAHLDFSESGIKENNRLIVEICKEERKKVDIIFVPIISPYRISREHARKELSTGFFEVFFSASLDTVMNRDVKGLYKKAVAGEINNMIGYASSNPYEVPAKPELIINSSENVESLEFSVNNFFDFVVRKVIS